MIKFDLELEEEVLPSSSVSRRRESCSEPPDERGFAPAVPELARCYYDCFRLENSSKSQLSFCLQLL